ncbi:MAG: hypothetical protein ACRCX2_19495 [Paraclostridium sp.]
MAYKLSQYQLFNIFCKGRECETCPYHEQNCDEEFYEDISLDYEDFKTEE